MTDADDFLAEMTQMLESISAGTFPHPSEEIADLAIRVADQEEDTRPISEWAKSLAEQTAYADD